MDILLRFLIFVVRGIIKSMQEGNQVATLETSADGSAQTNPARLLSAVDIDTDDLAQIIDTQQRHADKLITTFQRIGPTAQVFVQILERNLVPRIEAQRLLVTAANEAGTGLEGLLARGQKLAGVKPRLDAIERNLTVLDQMATWRSAPVKREMFADADAIAHALLAPLQRHFDVYEVPFPHARPISAPANPDQESIWFGLLPKGYPVIFVPQNFGEDLYRQASVAHEIGHLVLHRVPGFKQELTQVSIGPVRDVLSQNPQLANFLGQLYGAWIVELFSDMFAMIMLGPAGLRGMTHAFEKPDEPQLTQFVRFNDDGTPAEHPPAHLRVLLSAHMLIRMGFDQEAAPILREWSTLHHDPQTILVPLDDGRVAELPAELVQAAGDKMLDAWYAAEFRSLGGYQLENIPGLEMSPGLWARAKRRANQLAAGKVFHDDARIVLAAAIEARAKPTASTRVIAQALRHAILGLDAREIIADDPNYGTQGGRKRASGKDSLLAAARDALVLHEVLGERTGRDERTLPHRRRPRFRI